MAELNGPALSVVIPAHNSGHTLERCLASVCGQIAAGDEVIVVDDGSTDEIAGVARGFPVAVMRLERRSGPAAARNQGAERATRPVLFFVDADVVLHGDAIGRGRAHFVNPGIDGVIGSYDDRPEAPTLVSRFKNLAHHHFHQRAAGRIGSFWGACGFIRRDAFVAAGGFDDRRFTRPSIEDVELGWRITDRGGCLVLDPDIQGTHLKQWTLGPLIRTDVIDRAAPWVRWSLERRKLGGELNASPLQKLALIIAVALAIACVIAVPVPAVRIWAAVLAVAAGAINIRLFLLFLQQGGWRLLAAGFLLQQLYYLCALAGLVRGVVSFCRPRRRSVAAPAARVRA
jgi:GT2 family glycosyltransferase